MDILPQGRARRSAARRRLCLALALTTGGWATSGSAQQIADLYRPDVQRPEQAEVLTRSRPEYDPIGGRIGSFFLFPTASLDATYNDNIYGTETAKTDDFFGSARLAATIESRWSRHRLAFDAYGRVNRYADRHTENSEAYGAHGSGQYDISRESIVQLDAQFDHAPEDRLNINAFASRRPILYNSLVATGGLLQRFGNLQLTGRAQVQRTTFENSVTFAGAPFSQAYRDATRSIFTGIGRYELQGGAAVILAGSYDTLNYDDDVTFNRDSHGYRLEAGLGLELSTLISAEARVGYLSRKNDNPLLRNPKGFSFYANVVWNPTPLMTVRLVADRDIEESSSATVAGNLRAEARLTVDYELLRAVIVSPSVRYANIKPVGSPLTSNEVEFNLRARYLLSHGLRLNGELRHFHRGSGLYRPVTANAATVGISKTF